jgi:hypothetical protein
MFLSNLIPADTKSSIAECKTTALAALLHGIANLSMPVYCHSVLYVAPNTDRQIAAFQDSFQFLPQYPEAHHSILEAKTRVLHSVYQVGVELDDVEAR